MPKRDPRVDAYIRNAAPFAQPILVHIREAVHAGCPDVEETLKWSVPHFDYEGPLCGLAAFKAHVRFGFWKAGLLARRGLGAVPSMGTGKLTSVSELPARPALIRMVKAAAVLNESGVKKPRPLVKKPAPRPPAFLAQALRQHPKAAAAFAAFAPSHKREYIDWLTDAKTTGTRDRRLAQALTWLAAGKSRNWKYQK